MSFLFYVENNLCPSFVSWYKLKIKEEDWECEYDAPIHHVAQTKDRYNDCIHIADSPFDGIEKATVLQDAKNFNVSKFVTGKPQECCQVRQI